MTIQPLIGLGGDLATFFGGVVLAWDAIVKERQFKKRASNRKENSKQLESPLDRLTKVKVGDTVYLKYEDVERALDIRQSARRAVRGCSLLVLGFVLLLITRLYEVAPYLKSIILAIKHRFL